nr:immunoglobulin light chain junction region [Macaca mulatta]
PEDCQVYDSNAVLF